VQLDQNCDLWAGRGNAQKIKKGGRRKSQNRYFSPPRGGAILQPIFTKFDEFVDLTDVITQSRLPSLVINCSLVFPVREVENRIFPKESIWP